MEERKIIGKLCLLLFMYIQKLLKISTLFVWLVLLHGMLTFCWQAAGE